MGAKKLGKDIGVDSKTAKAYIDVYFARYPGVRDYMERTRKQAADQGYVETLFGRRLYLPTIHSNRPQERAGAERTAINAPMQGTAADIIKRAMVTVDNWLASTALDARVILQVHDELVLEVVAAELDEITAIVTAEPADTQRLEAELPFFATGLRIAVFPDWETLPYDSFSPQIGRASCRERV